MLKFETAWREKFEYYARLFDDTENKSVVQKIPSSTEYYIQHQKGLYNYILDYNIKLERKLGTSKDAKDQFGVRNPIDVYIRDNHWKKSYNTKPRIWYLDIETRTAQSFITNEYDNKKIKIRRKE